MSREPANTTFEDPSFRKALRKQLGRETAPPALRARIVVALDDAQAAQPVNAPRRNVLLTRPMVGLALAASVLIVIGIGVTIAMRSGSKSHPVAVLPRPFAEAMAARHDSCGEDGSHRPSIGGNDDLASIGKRLRDELGFPPLVTSVGDDWKFQGAQVCRVDNVRTAHLLFTRGDQSLSIFSIPAKNVYSPPDGARYQLTINNHPIAGFVKGTTIYCVVGKSPKGDLTLTQVQNIVDSLEKRM